MGVDKIFSISSKPVNIPDTNVWLELQQKEYEEVNKEYEEEIKNRRKKEVLLIVTCLLALIYSYPVVNFKDNPLIEINFL